MKNLLEKLSNASGVSGFEDEVRDIIAQELEGYVDQTEVDNLGNLIAVKKGIPTGKKVMLAAHMDEIGLMIRYIDKKGFIKFTKIGGINDQMLLNQEVYIHHADEKILGVIGSKPPHRMKASERKKVIEYDNMFIDIGASSREEAEKKVGVGDPITLKQDFALLSEELAMGKALDNRVGCAVMIDVLKRVESNATIYGVGTVQEEVGLKGARTSAFRINPDLALVLDVTISGDHPGMKEEDAPAKMGKGPCIILTDASGRGIITHPQVKKTLIRVAEENNIPVQLEVSEGGTTDATSIHLTREGIPSGVISPATRYIHTPVSVVNIPDVELVVELILAVLKEL
jgi:endoglucanase